MATQDPLEDWPALPAGEPIRPLYVCRKVPAVVVTALVAKGWAVSDVRTLPTDSDTARLAALKAWLEGLRLGSIEAGATVAKFVEMEARLLLNDKSGGGQAKTNLISDGETVDQILGIGGETASSTDKRLKARAVLQGKLQEKKSVVRKN